MSKITDLAAQFAAMKDARAAAKAGKPLPDAQAAAQLSQIAAEVQEGRPDAAQRSAQAAQALAEKFDPFAGLDGTVYIALDAGRGKEGVRLDSQVAAVVSRGVV